MLGLFEQLLMTALTTLKGEGHGALIYDKACELDGKRLNLGSAYLTLDRLESKGMLSSRLTDPTKEPRGRPKRVYRLERPGFEALENTVRYSERLTAIYRESVAGARARPKHRGSSR
jgi:DNA-binding PadR family transcriptional regulator